MVVEEVEEETLLVLVDQVIQVVLVRLVVITLVEVDVQILVVVVEV